MTEKHPRIGVAAIIINPQGQILLGKRIGKHAGGTRSFFGGHLEFGETPAECAAREALEETGITLDPESLETLVIPMTSGMTRINIISRFFTVPPA